MFSGQKEKEFKELLESVQTSLLAVQTLDKVLSYGVRSK